MASRLLQIAGVRVRVRGALAVSGPTLFVANHVSYLDIVVLGSLVDAGFVAKSEVAAWPLIGLLARIGRTVFIRRRVAYCAGECNALAERLSAGESLLLFAEGTSSDGGRVLPFKNALFAAVERSPSDRAIQVQPVTIAYARLRGGLPIGYALRPLYAWYGDMQLAPHLWAVLGLPGAVIEVHFHPPLVATKFRSRKALARHAERQVADSLVPMALLQLDFPDQAFDTLVGAFVLLCLPSLCGRQRCANCDRCASPTASSCCSTTSCPATRRSGS